MTTIRKSDMAVFDGLSIVRLDGFEPTKDLVTTDDGTVIDNTAPDPPGTANWLVSEYGLQAPDFDPEQRGILWADYDAPGWRFSVLIASDEVEDFAKLATEAGYEVRSVEPITEPIHYGDGGGVVAILRHPDGWCVLS